MNNFKQFNAYIGGQGVIYANVPKPRRNQLLPLRPVKQDTGNNPDAQRPDYGDFFAQSDFSHGAFQERFHSLDREDPSDPKKFLRSEGFDISVPGKLTHLHKMLRAPTEALDSMGQMAVVKDLLFFITEVTQPVYKNNGVLPGTWSTENPGPAEAMTHLVSKGDELLVIRGSSDALARIRSTTGVYSDYCVLPANTVPIKLRDTAASPEGVYEPTLAEWLKDRLIAVGQSSVNLHNAIWEITRALEKPLPLQKLEVGWQINALFQNGPYIYAVASSRNSGQSEILHFGLNSAGSALEAKGSTELPVGDIAFGGCAYLGKAYVGAGRKNVASGTNTILYELIPDASGFLHINRKLIDEVFAGNANLYPRSIVPIGDSILIGLSLSQDSKHGPREGVAIFNLARDSLATYFHRTLPGGDPWAAEPHTVSDITTYKDRRVFALTGSGSLYGISGVWYESATFVPVATLITSIADWGNRGLKDWDNFEISTEPLPADTKVEVYYTTKHPDENVWTLAMTHDVDGETRKSVKLTNVKSDILALKIVSYANTGLTAAPKTLGFSVRSLPSVEANKAEYVITAIIRVLAEDRIDGGLPVHQNPVTVKNFLEALAYQPTTYVEQEGTWDVRVESIEDYKPEEPIYDTASGEALKNGYELQLQMVGRKQ